jgi:hypothetical protein
METRGWETEGEMGNGLEVFRHQASESEVLLPPLEAPEAAFEEYSDHALEILSWEHDLSRDELVKLLQSWKKDSLQIRIDDPSLPSLETASELVSGLRLFMAYAAKQEEDPKPYHPTPGKRGTEFAKYCEFGHTEKQSFAFVVEVPLAPQMELHGTGRRLPRERRILERIIRGLSGFEHRSPLNAESGFSANMCETFAEIAEKVNSPFGVRARWSTEWKPSSKQLTETVRVNEVVQRRMSRWSKELRTTETREVETIRAPVVQLSKDPNLLEDREKYSGVAEVRYRPPKKSHSIKLIVHLNEYQHDKVHRAYGENAEIKFEGTRKKTGNRWHVYDPKDLRVVGLPGIDD